MKKFLTRLKNLAKKLIPNFLLRKKPGPAPPLKRKVPIAENIEETGPLAPQVKRGRAIQTGLRLRK